MLKRHSKNELSCYLTTRTMRPLHRGIPFVSAKALGLKAKHASRVRATRARDEATQRVTSSWSIWVFPPGITWENHMKPHSPELTGGCFDPCMVLWRGTCLGWLSLAKGDSGSTRILTRYYGAQSQIVRQLESLGTDDKENCFGDTPPLQKRQV
jgi:hypothetical protein